MGYNSFSSSLVSIFPIQRLLVIVLQNMTVNSVPQQKDKYIYVFVLTVWLKIIHTNIHIHNNKDMESICKLEKIVTFQTEQNLLLNFLAFLRFWILPSVFINYRCHSMILLTLSFRKAPLYFQVPEILIYTVFLLYSLVFNPPFFSQLVSHLHGNYFYSYALPTLFLFQILNIWQKRGDIYSWEPR